MIKCKVGIGRCPLQGSFFSQFGAENSKRHGVYLQKKVHLRRFTISTYMAKMPVLADFRHLHKHWSGTQNNCFKSSTQQQSCRAYKIGQFCHQGRPSICLWSKVRDRALTTFQQAPKWSKVANGGFCKFGSFQQCPTHRQLDWRSLVFIKSPFFGYPTCLLFAHLVWWSTALWTARTTRRRRPGRSLTLWCITSAGNFFN